MLTYSFPCQDLSLQGKGAGLEKGKASSMLWEVERLIKQAAKDKQLPKYLLMENVPAIFNVNHKPGLEKYLKRLEKLGYKNHRFTLNSKYFGVPQNRNRAFVLSELKQDKFTIPTDEGKEITKRNIGSILNLDEKKIWKLPKGKVLNWEPKVNKAGLAMTKIDGYTTFGSEACAFSLDSISPTITATGARSRIKVITGKNELSMLTSKELWQLMGFTIADWKKASKHNVVPEQYLVKQAGNSIVVQVLEEIFKNVK